MSTMNFMEVDCLAIGSLPRPYQHVVGWNAVGPSTLIFVERRLSTGQKWFDLHRHLARVVPTLMRT
jgi:hypothetical protein